MDILCLPAEVLILILQHDTPIFHRNVWGPIKYLRERWLKGCLPELYAIMRRYSLNIPHNILAGGQWWNTTCRCFDCTNREDEPNQHHNAYHDAYRDVIIPTTMDDPPRNISYSVWASIPPGDSIRRELWPSANSITGGQAVSSQAVSGRATSCWACIEVRDMWLGIHGTPKRAVVCFCAGPLDDIICFTANGVYRFANTTIWAPPERVMLPYLAEIVKRSDFTAYIPVRIINGCMIAEHTANVQLASDRTVIRVPLKKIGRMVADTQDISICSTLTPKAPFQPAHPIDMDIITQFVLKVSG